MQYQDYRLLWFGQLVSTVGTQMQLTAVDWHVYNLLNGRSFTISLFGYPLELGADALGLGLLGLVRVLPILFFALLGGLLADTRDRRWLMIGARTIAALFAGTLALLTLIGRDNVTIIYILTAAGAAAMAFDNPARQSLVPNLVPREHLANAVSLNTLTFQIGTILGPALAGFMIYSFNIGYIYAINTCTFLAVVVSLLLMNYRGRPTPGKNGVNWQSLREGLRFTYRTPIIWSTMLLDFWATFFSSARTMLPIVANEVLHVGEQGYGILATAQPVGSVITGIIISLRPTIHRQGIVMLISVVVYGVATALFGVSNIFLLSYLFFALTGAADTVSTVIRGTVRQLLTPDDLRGRMTSVNMMFFMGGPQLGELEAGLVAAVFGAPFSIVTGGIATIFITAWIAWKFPVLRHYLGNEEK